MLTGRIRQISAEARIDPEGDQYVPLGASKAQGWMRELDFFAADSWRARPSLTVSAGMRYVLQLPFYPTNNSDTTITEDNLYGVSGLGRLFEPATLTGTRPTFIEYPAGTYAYNADRNNLAPSASGRGSSGRDSNRHTGTNALAGSSVDSFRPTQLLGDNQARIVQLGGVCAGNQYIPRYRSISHGETCLM